MQDKLPHSTNERTNCLLSSVGNSAVLSSAEQQLMSVRLIQRPLETIRGSITSSLKRRFKAGYAADRGGIVSNVSGIASVWE